MVVGHPFRRFTGRGSQLCVDSNRPKGARTEEGKSSQVAKKQAAIFKLAPCQLKAGLLLQSLQNEQVSYQQHLPHLFNAAKPPPP